MELEGTTTPAAAVVDLDSIVEVDTAEYELLHPATGQPLGQVVTIMGPEHPKRKAMEQGRARELRLEFRKQGKMPVSDPVEDEAEAYETLITCTIALADRKGERPVIVGGKPVTFTEQTRGTVLRDFYTAPKRTWLAKQVLRALQEQDRFIESSVKG
ncbi:MAG TPA: hypothetical protein VEA40_07445 [Ramlibacter sp.]|nr:hypothetical protein [Ramlibacter sp.]